MSLNLYCMLNDEKYYKSYNDINQFFSDKRYFLNNISKFIKNSNKQFILYNILYRKEPIIKKLTTTVDFLNDINFDTLLLYIHCIKNDFKYFYQGKVKFDDEHFKDCYSIELSDLSCSTFISEDAYKHMLKMKLQNNYTYGSILDGLKNIDDLNEFFSFTGLFDKDV